MSINIYAPMGFENRNFIQNTANSALSQNDTAAQNNTAEQNSYFYTENGLPSHQYVLMASTQITLNKTLKETLKYLKTHENKTKKKPVFGELWQIANTKNEEAEKNPYHGDLIDMEIDLKSKNIFAA